MLIIFHNWYKAQSISLYIIADYLFVFPFVITRLIIYEGNWIVKSSKSTTVAKLTDFHIFRGESVVGGGGALGTQRLHFVGVGQEEARDVVPHVGVVRGGYQGAERVGVHQGAHSWKDVQMKNTAWGRKGDIWGWFVEPQCNILTDDTVKFVGQALLSSFLLRFVILNFSRFLRDKNYWSNLLI